MNRTWDKSKPPAGPWAFNKDSQQAQGLALWMPMSGASAGNVATDYAGSRHGTIVGSKVWTRGAHGQSALTLNGSTDYVTTPSGLSILKTTPFSLFVRARPTAAVKMLIAAWDVGVTSGWQWLINSGGIIDLGIYDADGSNGFNSSGAGSFADGVWRDLCTAYSGSNTNAGIKSYANGSALSMTGGTVGSTDPGTLTNTAPQIGARAGAVLFTGDMSDVRIYLAELSADRVAAMSDPASRYELQYPLRSSKWMVSGSVATAVTMSGPSSGYVSAASTNFTVGANGGITGTVRVTPADGGAGGTFTPTYVDINTGSPTGTFTYTPASTGAKTISVTNDGSLTNPSSISYTSITNIPATPTIGTATAGNAAASVYFTPGVDGGATPTYTATSSPGGLTGTGASPITVSGLTNGVAYTFTVVASNVNGASSASSASNSVTPLATVSATKLAPFLDSDVLSTPIAQAFYNDSGTMTATGTAPTVNTVANIANGRQTLVEVIPNGSDGSFHGVIRWATGSGEYFCEELSIGPRFTFVPLVTRTVTKVCNLPVGTDISGTIGYQIRDSANSAVGSHVTTGIATTPLVTGPDKFCADIALAPGSYFIVWDNGAGVYSQDELVVRGVAQPTGTKTATVTLVDAGDSPRASLTGLSWAWWDQITPDLFTTPTDQGTGESTDGSGVLSITVHTALAASGVGWLVVTDSDGTTTQSPVHKAFSGPVAVA